MLPGFRFLFAAVMLSMSLLIFGLGAAALLRAAHESFASNSSWRATPDVPFAQRPESTLPMLATLRVEPVTEKAIDAAKVAAAPTELTPPPAEPAANDQVAGIKPAEIPAVEAAKPAPADASPASEAAPVADAPADASPTAATKMAAITAPSDVSPVNNENTMTEAQPAAAPSTNPTPAKQATAPETAGSVTKIATLGGPPVDIAPETPVKEKTAAKPEQAKDDQSAVKKRARRAAHRRHLSARARLAIQQLQLQQNPFAPLPVPATTTRQQRQQSAITP